MLEDNISVDRRNQRACGRRWALSHIPHFGEGHTRSGDSRRPVTRYVRVPPTRPKEAVSAGTRADRTRYRRPPELVRLGYIGHRQQRLRDDGAIPERKLRKARGRWCPGRALSGRPGAEPGRTLLGPRPGAAWVSFPKSRKLPSGRDAVNRLSRPAQARCAGTWSVRGHSLRSEVVGAVNVRRVLVGGVPALVDAAPASPP